VAVAGAPAHTFIGVISVKDVPKVFGAPVLTSVISHKIKDMEYSDMYLLEMDF
jgi:hypothetical protein